MFKRIGATIVTIVMLLSMASVVSLAAESAKMELDVTLLDENNQQIATVYPGDKINAVVKIKNPVAVTGMTVAGIYNSDVFTAGAPVVENPADVVTEKVLTGTPSDPVDGKILVAWIAETNVLLADDTVLMTVPLTVKAEATPEETDLSFYFVQDGMYFDDEGNPVALEETQYSAEKVVAPITVSNTPAVETTLEVIAPAAAEVGQEITVKIKVKGYAQNWSALTIVGSYNDDVLELISEKTVKHEFKNSEIVENSFMDAANGVIAAAWFNENVVEKPAEFELLELTFKVKALGDANLSFSFKEDDIYGANNVPITEGFSKDPVEKDITITEPTAPIVPTALEVIAPAEAEVGQEITVKIKVKDYAKNWSALTIVGSYNDDVLELINEKTVKHEFKNSEIVEESFMDAANGIIAAAWFNENVVDNVGTEFDALTLTFKVKALGDANLSFSFKEDDIYGANNVPITEGFSKGPVEKDITITAPAAPIVPTSLEVIAPAEAEVGQEITVKIKVKDYAKNWSTLSIIGSYNANVLDLIEESTVKGTFKKSEVEENAIFLDQNGTIKAVWINENVVDNVGPEFDALTLTFKVKAAGNANFSFSFIEDGIYGKDETDKITTGFVKEPVNKEITINPSATPAYLTMVLEKGNAMKEGDDGVLRLYLNEYTSQWSSVPVVLTFNSDLIRIKESEIVCNPLGGVDGDFVLRADDDKVVFTWFALQNIEAYGSPIELASIPFKAYQEGEALFDAEFVADGLLTRNQQGGYDVVHSDTYVADTEEKKVTINDQYPNMEPMFLTIDTANEAIKNKKETLTLTLNNFNPRMRNLSVKLFYDKDKVTISEEDIQEMLGDGTNIDGGYVLNKNEGYIHFTWALTDGNMVNATNPTLATLRYTPNNGENVSFYAVFDQVIDNEMELMAPVYDYVERSEDAIVNIKANPSLSATADKTNVKIGDTVTLTVSVNDYLNLWSNMTINGSYDKDLLRLESITLSEAFGNKNYELGDGSFKAIWSNAENIIAGSDFPVITLVFKVIDCGTAKFNITLEDVLTNGNTPLTPNEDYLVNAERVDEINIEICEHVWSSKITHKEGTSGDASMHTQTCTKGCGAIKEEGCTLTKTKTKASCGVNGTITYKCSLCGYNETFDDLDAPALTHKFDGKPVHKAGTQKHVYTCTRGCGATKEENCTAKKQVVEATCLKDGYTIFSCTVCGDIYIGDVVKAKGKHGVLTLHYIAPTATTNGSIITQCDTCKEYVVPPYAGAVKKTLKAGHPFPDVQDPKSWYYDAVNFSKAFEIFGGDEKGNFNPTANITRGQLVTVLGRIIKAEAEKTMSAAEFNKFLNAQTSKVSGMKSTSGFTDLGGKYYERYAKLFAKWGIVNGYPDGTFGGDKNITREEMATLIKRFVEAYPDANVNTIKFGNAATFSDFAKVSGWAKGNVEWVGKVGLFQGDTAKKYNPQNNATRAEIAVVIYRMLPVLKNICVCSLNH